MDFASDNVFGVHERIMNALVAANAGTSPSYGVDPWTREAEERLSELFERQVASFLVMTGTAANALALSQLVPPYGAVFAHADAHVMVDECGAPELFTGGAKLMGIAAPNGKITPDHVARLIAGFIRGEHDPKPAAVSIAQATELGTIYGPAEIAKIAELCRAKGMKLHMDGARFANAVVALDCAPADITWRVGVDALSFGCTKNGALALEAVIFFDEKLANEFIYRRMRSGQLLSKGRFLGAQMLAYLEGDLWLNNARHANAMAKLLGDGLARISGIRLAVEVAANEVFVIMPRSLFQALSAEAHCFEWPGMGSGLESPGPDEALVRLVCSFRTTEEDVGKLLRLANAVRPLSAGRQQSAEQRP
jgi:threonine aldolase